MMDSSVLPSRFKTLSIGFLVMLLLSNCQIEARARLGRNNNNPESEHARDLLKLQDAIVSELTYELDQGIDPAPENVAEVLESEYGDTDWWQRLVDRFKESAIFKTVKDRARKEYDENWAPAIRKGVNDILPTLRKYLE